MQTFTSATATFPSFEDCGLFQPGSEAYRQRALAVPVFADDDAGFRDVSLAEGMRILDTQQALHYFLQCQATLAKQGRVAAEADTQAVRDSILALVSDPANIAGLEFCWGAVRGDLPAFALSFA